MLYAGAPRTTLPRNARDLSPAWNVVGTIKHCAYGLYPRYASFPTVQLSFAGAHSLLLARHILHLCRGRFGIVYKGRIVSSNKPCAIKSLTKRTNKKADVSKEVAVMKSLEHPSIIAFIDYYELNDQFVLVTEL